MLIVVQNSINCTTSLKDNVLRLDLKFNRHFANLYRLIISVRFFLRFITKQSATTLLLLLMLSSFGICADTASEEDKNIQVIFPPDLMRQMLAETNPGLFSNLKYSSAADEAKTKSEVETFQQQFLQGFQVLVTASLKENFTPEEIAEWAKFQTTPLGSKTMLWLKTKYPGILNKAMDAPMQDLYKSMATG